jgi:hypothetical protein
MPQRKDVRKRVGSGDKSGGGEALAEEQKEAESGFFSHKESRGFSHRESRGFSHRESRGFFDKESSGIGEEES